MHYAIQSLILTNTLGETVTAVLELIEIFTDIDDEKTMSHLFEEIFTEKERRDIAMRWQLLKELHEGQTQRKIAANHKISLCKITRGSKILKDPESVIRRILIEKYGEKERKE